MANKFKKTLNIRIWSYMLTTMLTTITVWGQAGGEKATSELVLLGFENVRWAENENERIYSIENVAYKIQEIGLSKAIEVIEKEGLPEGKKCKIIITRLDMPEIALTYNSLNEDSTCTRKWNASYELKNSWKEVKRNGIKNSSRFKVDLLVYPQLSYQNMDITKIYQVMFSLNPALEVSLWQGMKLTGQVILPVYVDTKGYAAYSTLYKKVRPGFLTLSQRFRLPGNIRGRAVVGTFSNDQYGVDLELFRPFKDRRFALEARVGYTGWGYWDGFKLHYNNQYQWTWSAGGSFYWPRYDVQFCLKGEQYLLGEKGVKFEMIRHFRYASVGFYAMKAEKANSNGGFRVQVALPPYKQKRHKYIPRISTSKNMGIIYNAGNERYYYKQYRAESSDNIMENNRYNPIYIENNLLN
jgi:hypothetical protein